MTGNSITHVTSINPHLTQLGRASFELQQAIRTAAQAVRNCFADADVADLNIRVRVSGRTHGDLKVEFNVGELYGDDTKAYDLEAATIECLRRRGWNQVNAPTLISYTGETKTENGGPF
jgi:hypothetical protein